MFPLIHCFDQTNIKVKNTTGPKTKPCGMPAEFKFSILKLLPRLASTVSTLVTSRESRGKHHDQQPNNMNTQESRNSQQYLEAFINGLVGDRSTKLHVKKEILILM